MTTLRHQWQAAARCPLLLITAIGALASVSAAGKEPSSAFRFDEDAGALTLYEGDRPVLAYNFGIQKKAGVPDDRARSCYIHPLYGLDGEVLTDDFPADHYHHRGLFWAWPHVRIGSEEYDLWMLRGIRHQFERWTERTSGPTTATLVCKNGWYVQERKVLEENLRLVIHQATAAGRRIDIDLRLTATAQPVTLWGAAGKSYGGLSLRFAPRRDTAITTATGLQPTDLDLTRLSWADLSGRFSATDARSGVALFVAPDHPDYPPTWVTRHYGFMGVGWPGEAPFTLPPGKTTTLRYALWIHRGAADVSALKAVRQASFAPLIGRQEEQLFSQAAAAGRQAQEALIRSRRYVAGWLAHADPKSGLIPRNLDRDRDLWNGRDAAADNYPFLVLTAALTDRGLFEGRMRQMLGAEESLTRRLDRLGDHFLFSKQTFAHQTPDLERIIFDNAEYVKDGLVPITEWLGPSPWSERMIALTEDIWKHAGIETPFGKIPTTNFEVNGDLLQACSRLYWFTGERKFLDFAIRLGDYYLLGDQHPTRDLTSLRLSDHGCEVVNGLSELYVAVSYADRAKARQYREPLHAIYDCILERGRNQHGQLYATFNPQTGEHNSRICDTWGYNYDGLYTAWLVDRRAVHRDALRHVLGNLEAHYTGFDWGRMDGYADSLEGAINLYNREAVPSAAAWIDSEIRTMWSFQKDDGVIEGWHGDGNFARTSLMYALWKTQGLCIEPWRADVRLGAVRDDDRLLISLFADQPWSGKLRFDRPRHKDYLHLPLDYPRINQFPEWFTVDASKSYTCTTRDSENPVSYPGDKFLSGIELTVQPNRELRLVVY
jgi:hypothetical protein